MNNKLILYIDGSYKDRNGAWGIVGFYNAPRQEVELAFGRCQLESNVQAELLACIKALEHIKNESKVKHIEIRTDYLDMVNILNQVVDLFYTSINQIENKFGQHNINLTRRLVELLIKREYIVKFSKTSKKDVFGRRAHNLAQQAMQSDFLSTDIFYIWDDFQKQPIQFDHFCELNKDSIFGLNKNEVDRKPVLRQMDILCKEVIDIKLESILLCEELHLATRTLNLGGMLSKYRNDASALQPIVVRRLDNETYGLVLGFKAYCIAKILGIKVIKAHITDLKRQDLVKYNLEVEVGYF